MLAYIFTSASAFYALWTRIDFKYLLAVIGLSSTYLLSMNYFHSYFLKNLKIILFCISLIAFIYCYYLLFNTMNGYLYLMGFHIGIIIILISVVVRFITKYLNEDPSSDLPTTTNSNNQITPSYRTDLRTTANSSNQITLSYHTDYLRTTADLDNQITSSLHSSNCNCQEIFCMIDFSNRIV